jgi:hypothetical protein
LASEIRPAMRCAYFIAGRRLLIDALDPWSAKLADNFLRDFHLQPDAVLGDPVTGESSAGSQSTKAPESNGIPSYTIRIRSQVTPPNVPAGLESFEVAFGRCYVDGATCYLEIEDSLVVVGPHTLDIWIGQSDHAKQSLSLVNVLSYALEAALRRSGLYQLHGAGVAPPNGNEAVLFLGESGSGKSTLASLLAAGGWSYLTDDALLLSQENDEVIARGIRRFFAASETTLKASSLADLSNALGPRMLTDPSKRRLEPEAAFPERFIASCKPEVLCFISITGTDQTRIAALPAREAMSRLITSNPWASYDNFTAHNHLKVLNRLVNQCRVYVFASGLDILREPARVEALVAPLLIDTA